jgi:hypothetical protein
MVLQCADSRFCGAFVMILSCKAHCFSSLQSICSTRRDTTARSGHGFNRN